MARKRVTQMFPFLLPLRKWQRKKLFYLKMAFDKNVYAEKRAEGLLPDTVFETSSLMLNKNSGFDMKYQINKVHNLKLAAKTIDRLVIEPGEIFSFWRLVRWADRKERYKDGLNLVYGKIAGVYGGGLCQLSDMLFWMFLHTPMTVVERHGHTVLRFPSTTEELPCGVDATINEGWLDLKVRNGTENRFQIVVWFDEESMHGRILSQAPVEREYFVFNPSVSYGIENGKTYQTAIVSRAETDKKTGIRTERELYQNKCEIAYKLPDSAKDMVSGEICACGTDLQDGRKVWD